MSDYDIVYLTNDIKELNKARGFIIQMLLTTDFDYDKQTKHEFDKIEMKLSQMINKLYQKIGEIENEQE